MFFSTLALGLAATGSWIDLNNSSLKKNIFYCTLPFCAFLFSVFNIALFYQFVLFAIGAGFYLFFKIFSNWWFFSLRTKEPFLVLLLFFVLFSWIYETVSPFYDRSFFSLPGRLDYFLGLEHAWENAKAHDFIGTFSQNYRFGGFSQGLFVISPILSLAALVLDIPLADVYSKYDLVKYCLFFLFLFSSYGCYLFLRFGLKLSLSPSIIGGFSYILANSPLLSFVGNEYAWYIVPFTFLPWVMLCISQAYAKDRIEWLFLAGLIASLSQYIWSSHPEVVALFFGFSFTYIFWMAAGKLFSQGFQLKNIKQFFLEVITFPIAGFVGMAYFFIPLFEAIALMEYAAVDTSTTMGFWWGGAVEHYASIFFRFEDMNLHNFASGLYTATAGPVVGFYTGQFSLFMIFSFLGHTLIVLYRKCLQKTSTENYKINFPEMFFLILLVFCALTFPMGHEGWFSKFMEFTGFLRVHNFLRANMYFFFIALVTAMLGLHYLLKLKSIKTLFINAGVYILLLIGVYSSPLFPERIPDRILLDVCFFVAILILFSLLFWCSGRFKDYKITFGKMFFLILLVFCALIFPMEYEGWLSKFMELTRLIRVHNYLQENMYFSFIAVATLTLFSLLFWDFDRFKNKFSTMDSPFFALINSEKLVLGLIVCLGALSYYTLYPSARDYLTWGPYSANYLDKNRNFYSFRSGVVMLRGNRHDKASYDYLDERVNDFEKLFLYLKDKNINLMTAKHLAAMRSNGEVEKRRISLADQKKYETRVMELLGQRYAPAIEFKNYLNDQRRSGQISKETYKQAIKYLTMGDQKLAYFEAAAPTIDNFYLREDNPFTVPIFGVGAHRLAPLQHLTYSSYLYYLRDDYLFHINSSPQTGGLVLPIGKTHEFTGPSFYSAGPTYPSKNITFHIRAIFKKAHDNVMFSTGSVIPEVREQMDFYILGMNMKFVRPDPFIRKLLNIYGVDFLSFPQYYLDQKMKQYENPSVLEDLGSQGFVEFKFPESYRASNKFPQQFQMRVFTNPKSYGRAYIARWVKVIRPEESLANENLQSLGKLWPRSKKLTENFEKHMSSVPKDIWRSIIIESSELKDRQEVPRVFEGGNRVDIKKIIASKAVFDVDCQDELCWLVYNSAALNGWKAYSGSERLQIHKANLGFIGLKLGKGKQLVWLEYAPSSLVIGLLVMLTGWIFVFWFMNKARAVAWKPSA